jgi:catechol 2,3-dioxygenase-like lactoylglutathione lyase family enzyme
MPVLDCADVARSAAFYRDALGFVATMWGDPPRFAIVRRGTVTLGLASVHEGDMLHVKKNWVAYIYVADADGLYAQLQQRGVHLPDAPTLQPWGCRDFVLHDPDGHLLCFGQDMDGGAGL